jgi:hypothetical protein
MLGRIETILKSNWSSAWFANNTFINPKFKNDAPVVNLNALTDRLVQVIVARHLSNQPSSSQTNRPIADLFADSFENNNQKRLKGLLVDKSGMSDSLYDELIHNTTIDQNELYSIYMQESTESGSLANSSFDKSRRTAFLRHVFCDKAKFDKLVKVNVNKTQEQADADKSAMQAHLCNMTGKLLFYIKVLEV